MKSAWPWVTLLCVIIAAVCLGVALVSVVWSVGHVNHHTRGSIQVLQLARDLRRGEPIRASHLRDVEVPSTFEEAFERALKSNEKHLVLNRKAPRQMYAGEVLYAPTFMIDADTLRDMVNVRKGYELLSIPVDRDLSVREPLRPGSYVVLRGVFDTNPDESTEDLKTLTVVEDARIVTIDGSTGRLARFTRGRYDQVGVELTSAQVNQLLNVMHRMHSKRFILTLPRQPERDVVLTATVQPEVLQLMGWTRAPDEDEAKE